jgi:branched-chain amino acid transport system permease protein
VIWGGRAFRWGLAALAVAAPWVLDAGRTSLAGLVLVYALLGISLVVLTGWAGQVSLGQFAFAAIGAYVTAVLPWPFPLSVIAGGIAGAAVAVVIGLPALRLRGMHLAISTLAFAGAVTSLLLGPRALGRALPSSLQRPALFGLDFDEQRSFYYLVLAFLVLAFLAVKGIRTSRGARALIACRENEASAQAFGINLLRTRLAAFAVSGFMAAFAGGLFAFAQYGVEVPVFGLDQSKKMFSMVVIGGMGSLAGPLIGAAYVGAADVLGQDSAIFSIAATGIGVVLLLLFAPGGVGDIAFRIRDAMLRRVADRYRIDVPSLIADRKSAGRRAPIADMTRPSGGTIFIPRRYRIDGQWWVEARKRRAAEHV